jgi:DNA replication licensing factor MCM5
MKIAATGVGYLDTASMKKYIQYCKAKSSPRISDEACEVLTSTYVKIRDDGSSSKQSRDGDPTIPITVRQLEALVRISESLAKIRIDPIVRPEDVAEALRLFKVSTMASSSVDQKSHPGSGGAAVSIVGGVVNNRDEVDRTESYLRARLTVGSLVNRLKIIEDSSTQGYNPMIVSKCLSVMAGRGDLLERNQGRLIKRIK